MPTKLDMAKWLSGARAEEAAQQRPKLSLATGTAISDSVDGWVYVDLGGDTVSADGQQGVRIRTNVDVREGDSVSVTLDGAEGTATTPKVIGADGGGDRTREAVNQATSDASKAKDAASDAAASASKAQQAADAAQAQATQTAETLAQAQEYLDGIRQWVSDGQSFLGFQDVGEATAQLTIANRDSSFYTTLTNTRQEYHNGSSTIMAIDGQHGRVEASALAVGSYEWQSTNAGANMTLVYIG